MQDKRGLALAAVAFGLYILGGIGSLLLDIVNGFLQLFSTVVLFRCFMLCSQQPR